MKILLFLIIILLGAFPVLGAGTLSVKAPGYDWQDGEYSTSHVFIDEVAGTSADIEVRFAPGVADVIDVEVFSNLNRRDLATGDKNGDGYDDGIVAVDGTTITDSASDTDLVTGHYFAPTNMSDGNSDGTWEVTIPAVKTGAYRLTARFKTSGNPNWQWYGLRDHAVVVAPVDARSVRLYEINVLNIEASGDTFATRSTLEDLHNAPGAPHAANNRWDLDYLTDLGANWLWFQPIHPAGIDGREPEGGYGSGTPMYDPGSPYAVKNFFEVNPLMTKDFVGSSTNAADLTSATNRAAAMTVWQNFVSAADAKEVGIMLDAPFNHTAFDVELAQAGIDLLQPDGQSWSASDEIRNREGRFFSRDGDYGERAFSAASIGAAPDRFDFGKWNDVKDVYFGRYDALVEVDSEPERSSYLNEGDWFDSSDSNWTTNDITKGGVGKNVTRQVWRYFAEYALHWLEKTRPAGENRNSTSADGTLAQRYAWDQKGIDGLRCDFGQGLPPRAWEYVINTARSKKWNFVMMSESLDGGTVTYRSSRHFDILNENIVFPLQTASNKYDYRGIMESRRSSYGQALVLINNTSHDEENYTDPWQALIRYSVGASMGGVPLIFPGQELGISRTYGYDHYETNFGKEIAHFKRYNSMMTIWNDSDFGNDQLSEVYAGMNRARKASPALNSSNRWFLDGNANNDQIHAVAKYEAAGASPAGSDVVIAFANLDRDNDQTDTFQIPNMLADLMGLENGRTYNVKNSAAYTGQDATRDDAWLWGGGLTRADLTGTGFFVGLKDVPGSVSEWSTAPFEGQYLKVYDVTPPPSPEPLANYYQLGTTMTFTWDPASAGGDPVNDVVDSYLVTVRDDSGTVVSSGNVSDGSNSYSFSGVAGETYRAEVTAVSAAGISSTSPGSSFSGPPDEFISNTASILLDPDLDEDGDGDSNGVEAALGGRDPLFPDAPFRIISIGEVAGGIRIVFTSIPGDTYVIESSTNLGVAPGFWIEVDDSVQANSFVTTFVFTGSLAEGPRRFYRVGRLE